MSSSSFNHLEHMDNSSDNHFAAMFSEENPSCLVWKGSQTRRGSSDYPINHYQIIQQLRKIIIVETKCESTFYEILGTYTGAIVIGLRNHKVVKFYKKLNVLLRFMVKYDFMVWYIQMNVN